MTSRPARRWSLARRLTRRALVLAAFGWLATVALSLIALNHELEEMFDEELQALVETTILSLDATSEAPIPRSWGVGTADGERLLRVFPAAGPAPLAPWPALSGNGFFDSQGWRILRRETDEAVIEIAHSKAWRHEEMIEAASALLVLIVPLGLLLLWGLRRLTARATAPVSRLAQSVAARRPDDLSPVDPDGLPDELRPLAVSVSAYLARIDTLRRSERDFIANAAHELRTPLAAIRARLDLSGDSDAKAAITGIDALTRRVERLLQLSRLEAGVGIGKGPADLVRLLRLLRDEMAPRDTASILFDDGDLETFTVAVDPDALAILLRNLMENAREHGDGTMTLRLTPRGKLSIGNPVAGPAPLAFSRFSAGAGSNGQGLGLSIVQAMSRAMGIGLDFESAERFVTVTLDFAGLAVRSDHAT
ncbi:histidine kinase dimerization/phospho-acceptor domain-containing protein [Pararhodobacter marinus]|uniref:histidine kinase dimerization/phospho-acceptor domain-containing protein n=1 Tax=Pararhodobacter marinus TaxID=2184063 RepID=UPI003511B03D